MSPLRRTIDFFDDEEVNRAEFWGAAAGGPTFADFVSWQTPFDYLPRFPSKVRTDFTVQAALQPLAEAVYVDPGTGGTISVQTVIAPSSVEPLQAISQLTYGWHSEQLRPITTAARPRIDFTVLSRVPEAAAPTGIYIDPGISGTIHEWKMVYQPLAISPQPVAPAGETVTLDKWWRDTLRPFYKAKRIVHVPNVAIAAEDPIPVTRWLGQQIRPVTFPKRIPRDFTILQFTPAAPVPAIFIDATSGGTISIKTLVYPSEARDPKPVTVAPETIRVDKWLSYPPIRIVKKRLPPIDFTTLDPKPVAVGIPIAGWYQPLPVPISVLKKLRVIYPQWTIDAAFFLVPAGPSPEVAWTEVRTATITTQEVRIGILLFDENRNATLIFEEVRIA